MLSIWLRCVLALQLVLAVSANRVPINNQYAHQQQCSGMYSREHWGGDTDPFLEVTFDRIEGPSGETPVVSLIIWEWEDRQYIGRESPQSKKKIYRCEPEQVAAQWCNETQIGEFLLAENARLAQHKIITMAINSTNQSVKYPILSSGYYCADTSPFHDDTMYSGTVQFRNAYGALPAPQIAKLPFYGALAIVYIVVGAFWAFLYVQHRHDILPVQNYITAIIIFLIFEMILTTGFYDFQNQHGNNIGTKIFLIVISILSAARNSFSFFLLLIVCMGYGVVKPTLGKTMTYVRILAGAHFLFGVIYAVASLSITPESAGPVVLFVILPLAATLTAFYVWTLNSLNETMKDLVDRKQNVKALMYRRLWWGILGSIMVVFGFFFINSFSFAGAGDPDFVPSNWRTRWFVLDGWLNLVYLADIAFISYLWRPSANNRRFAMSDELAQDDDGFEIASYGGSLDDEEDGRTPTGESTPPHNEASSSSRPGQNGQMPARPSLDAETMFSVADEVDKWSDEESGRGSDERQRLTKQ